MVHIVAQLKANNQVVVKEYRLADGYGRRVLASGTQEERDNNYYSTKVLQLEQFERIKEFVSPDSAWETLELGGTTFQSFPIAEVGRDSVRVENISTVELAQRRCVSLDLLEKSQHRQRKPRSWGLPQKEKVFRKAGADKILQGGAVFDKFVPKLDTFMLTLTLPGGISDAMECLSRYSGYLVNRLLQVIRRDTASKAPIYWFFVWEHQRRGALHLHLCAGSPGNGGELEQLLLQVKDKFYQVLSELSDKEGIDMFARRGFQGTWRNRPDKWQWDLQVIEKSVAASVSYTHLTLPTIYSV